LSHATHLRLRPRFRYRPKPGHVAGRPDSRWLCAHPSGEGVGTRTQSPALDELLATVREGDVVVINRLARLGRNMVHTIQLVEEFNRRGVHFRALDLGIDSRTPAGKMIIGVFSSFNQYERENNWEKSLASVDLAKRQGQANWRSGAFTTRLEELLTVA
jgi:DNA invertase Pin-like site-specific DNA recombinase